MLCPLQNIEALMSKRFLLMCKEKNGKKKMCKKALNSDGLRFVNGKWDKKILMNG